MVLYLYINSLAPLGHSNSKTDYDNSIHKYIKHTTYNIYVRTYTGVVALGPRQIVRV